MQLKVLLLDKKVFQNLQQTSLFHCFLLPEGNGPAQRTLLS